MNTKTLLALLGLCLVFISGCATPKITTSVPAADITVPKNTPAKMESDDLLIYYQNTHQLSQAGLLKILAELNSSPKSIDSDMQKAIVLGCLRGSVDLLRAISLLDSIIKSDDPYAKHLQPIASLLYANYSEWRRLDDALDKQGQQLKEAQRRSDQLNQKLEDLKAIEQQLPGRSHVSNEGRP